MDDGFSVNDELSLLQLLYQDRNVGVHYEYSIPKKFSSRTDPDSYTWVTDEFSSCSASCGGGIIQEYYRVNAIKLGILVVRVLSPPPAASVSPYLPVASK